MRSRFAVFFTTATLLNISPPGAPARAAAAVQAPPALVLSVDADSSDGYFRVDGVPKFLLFISYFDAMRRAEASGGLDADFQRIKERGFDGIRIFPTWWHYSCSDLTASTDGLFRKASDGGTLRPGKLAVLTTVLDKAKEYGLLVNVSFSYETYGETSFTSYKNQIVAVATAYAGSHRHAFFDLRNEYDSHTPIFSASDIGSIAADVRAVDPGRLLTASTGANNEGVAGLVAASEDLDLASPHDARSSSVQDIWFADSVMESVVDETRAGIGTPRRPILLSEPWPISRFPINAVNNCVDAKVDVDADRHRQAALHAKKHGAAGWTLHTRMTFKLDGLSYLDMLGTYGQAGERGLLGVTSGSSSIADHQPFVSQPWGIQPGFIDDPIVQGTTVIKASHIDELRARVNAQRQRRGYAPYSWTDSSLLGTVIRAVHINELRTALTPLGVYACPVFTTYSDHPIPDDGSLSVLKNHIVEIRTNVRSLEAC